MSSSNPFVKGIRQRYSSKVFVSSSSNPFDIPQKAPETHTSSNLFVKPLCHTFRHALWRAGQSPPNASVNFVVCFVKGCPCFVKGLGLFWLCGPFGCPCFVIPLGASSSNLWGGSSSNLFVKPFFKPFVKPLRGLFVKPLWGFFVKPLRGFFVKGFG